MQAGDNQGGNDNEQIDEEDDRSESSSDSDSTLGDDGGAGNASHPIAGNDSGDPEGSAPPGPAVPTGDGPSGDQMDSGPTLSSGDAQLAKLMEEILQSLVPDRPHPTVAAASGHRCA